LNGLNRTSTNIDYHFCNNLNPIIVDTSVQAINYLNSYKLFNLSINFQQPVEPNIDNYNVICSVPERFKYMTGYTTAWDKTADVFVNTELISYPNTLYNVVLHELIHSIGLNHTDVPSMMDYKVNMYYKDNTYTTLVYKNDINRLWLSLDDIKGLRKIKNNINNYNTCKSLQYY